MNITLNPRLEATLNEYAQREGVPPETLVLRALWEKFGKFTPPIEPRDEWESRVLAAGTDCGVSVPDSALSSDELYE